MQPFAAMRFTWWSDKPKRPFRKLRNIWPIMALRCCESRRSDQALRMSSFPSRPNHTTEGFRNPHELYSLSGRCEERDRAGAARLAQFDHCDHHAGDPGPVVRIRRESRSQAFADLCL